MASGLDPGTCKGRYASKLISVNMDVAQAAHGLGDPRLLETIDKLVELNIGESVALPQVRNSSYLHK